MAKPKLSNLLVFGVDVGSQTHGKQPSKLQATATSLMRLFERHQVASTWALPTMGPRLMDVVRGASVRHEIALQWTESPSTESKDAFRIAAEVRSAAAQALEHGVKLQSIVADPRGQLPYFALSKIGIRTVRPSAVRPIRQARSVQPQTLRYGIWGLPVSCYWPQTNRLFQHFLSRSLTHQIRHADRPSSVLHVVFDLTAITAASQHLLQNADRLLANVAEVCAETNVSAACLADVDAHVRMMTSAKPARSILRRQAA